MARRFCGKTKSGKLTLAAVALQDHITRSICVRSIAHIPLISGTFHAGSKEAASFSRKHKASKTRQPWTEVAEDAEYVLDGAPPSLSLAQRFGLVAGPSPRLTKEEWEEIKRRSIQEGDSSQPCVICREDFRLQPQVLLSCSHVFHKVCLTSFEKFSGRKCCPMCRKEQYETRVIYEGARLFREKCALRIQAFWRGYLVRKWYSNTRKHVPPNDVLLRRRFFEGKFQELNESLVQAYSTDVEAFLKDIDCSVAMSQDIQCRFNSKFGRVSQMEERDWQEAQEKAVQRGVHDCPICLNGLNSSREERGVLLLSCSHLYHEPCLLAFELFCQELKPRCPLCRSHYAKMLITTVAPEHLNP